MRIPASILVLLLAAGVSAQTTRAFDVVVYGGTAAGLTAAVAAAREGAQVALVEPGSHIGGMAASGLGWTDFGKKEVIGGLSKEFFERVGKKYNTDIIWTFEPHAAESVFNDMARDAKIQIFLRKRLVEKTGAKKEGLKIVSITAEGGDTFTGKVFLDATYEGDLLAQAGVSYTFGREGTQKYGESLAGVRPLTTKHQFLPNTSAMGSNGQPLPEIQTDPRGEIGAEDKKIQAYNFRLCMTDQAANRVPFTQPAGYNPARYALLSRHVNALMAARGADMGPGKNLMKLDIVHAPSRKTDTNNEGGFSTDYIGGSWDYPDASYARRAEIWKAHEEYQKGFFFFLSNDASIPQAFRDKMLQWGLAKNEFASNGNWPYQLYVRESRRMVGEYVMIQKDIQTERTKQDGIGMGSYNSDSHHVHRYVAAGGFVENEGDMQVAVEPYEIPYRILIPRRDQVSNLLVPVCFSASHVTYSTLRMEPQYMILGQAAGVAAKMAINAGKAVQDIDVQALRARLKVLKAELGATPVGSSVPRLMPPGPGRSRKIFLGLLPFPAGQSAFSFEGKQALGKAYGQVLVSP